MNIRFKIASALLATIRIDLRRPHPFAHERVGFISAGLAAAHDELLILAREYRPVRDDEYLKDPRVGAMMSAEAIRRARQWAMDERVAIFHVHTHGGTGIPAFSGIDIRENAKFVPNFVSVAPHGVHGGRGRRHRDGEQAYLGWRGCQRNDASPPGRPDLDARSQSRDSGR
jgi:proteasome lid subunit RPN8/RPN11